MWPREIAGIAEIAVIADIGKPFATEDTEYHRGAALADGLALCSSVSSVVQRSDDGDDGR